MLMLSRSYLVARTLHVRCITGKISVEGVSEVLIKGAIDKSVAKGRGQPRPTAKCTITTLVHSLKHTWLTLWALMLCYSYIFSCPFFSVGLHPSHVTLKFPSVRTKNMADISLILCGKCNISRQFLH